jgi:hypothetical protein
MTLVEHEFGKTRLWKNGGAEVGIKESGIIGIFHQTGKGLKRKGAKTERGLKERGRKERGIISF